MSIALAVLLFVRPFLIAFGIICVAAILIIGTMFVVEERRGYLREKNRVKTSNKVFRTAVKVKFQKLRTAVVVGLQKIQSRFDNFMREQAKAKIRRAKEAEAAEGFFEESFVRGFDSNGSIINRGVRIETEMATAYREMMDKIVDDHNINLFETTREL
jgi:hypothetical protein